MAGRLGRVTWILAALLAAAWAVGLGGCNRKRTYSQATPDDVIRSAVEMVKNKDTKRLGDLVYADTPEMRFFLDRLGELFGRMQVLAAAVEKRFPAEMAELKQKAADAAAAGKVDPLLAAISSGVTGGGRRGGGGRLGGGPPMDENAAQDLVNQLFADPYGWLERNATRLSTLQTTDDTATVMLDNKPIIPGVGLPLRLEGGKWYIALPTNFPGVSAVMPRSREQWSILVSVVKVLDRTVQEMTTDVEQGKVATLDSLAKKAREKAVLPGVIAFAAYGREIEVRTRVERRLKQFQGKEREWAKSREKAAADAAGDEPGKISPKLRATIGKLASSKIEPLVRKNKAPNFERMSTGEFEAVLATWLAEAGLKIALDEDLSSGRVDPEIARWEAALAPKKK